MIRFGIFSDNISPIDFYQVRAYATQRANVMAIIRAVKCLLQGHCSHTDVSSTSRDTELAFEDHEAWLPVAPAFVQRWSAEVNSHVERLPPPTDEQAQAILKLGREMEEAAYVRGGYGLGGAEN